MGKKLMNASHVEGTVYQHKLELKKTGAQSKNPGTEYITGTLEIITDNAGLNIVPVYFNYVTEFYTKSGKTNDTFGVLKNFINNVYKTAMKDGAEAATKVRVDGTIGLNEFYDRKNEGTLISVKRNEGSFVHVVASVDEDEKKRNEFDVDMVIIDASRKEANEEKNIAEKVVLKGYIFNFQKAILPVEFSVTAPAAMDYFEGLGASSKEPVFTRIRGAQISETVTRTITEEGAFGEPTVREVKNTRKDFVIHWASKEPYEWDSEDTILGADVIKAKSDREVYLAGLKKNYEDWKASQGGATAPKAPANGGFDF